MDRANASKSVAARAAIRQDWEVVSKFGIFSTSFAGLFEAFVVFRYSDAKGGKVPSTKPVTTATGPTKSIFIGIRW
jgi:hypothetical protein